MAPILATTFVVGVAPAQGAAGSTRQLQGFVAAFNRGDTAVLSEFVRTHFAAQFLAAVPLPTHLMVLGHMWEQSGGWDAFQLIEATDSSASATVRYHKGGAPARLSIRLDARSPYGVADVTLSPVAPAPPTSAPRPQALRAFLVPELARLARRDSLSGVVLVAKGDSILYQGAYGLAERNFSVANRLDTRFNLASMNKMFTGVAIAQLVSAGKLRLDDPVSAVAPGLLSPDLGARVQIRHLLSHTSGLGDYFGHPRWDSMSKAMVGTVDDYLAFVRRDTLAFDPGTRYSYSNSGFVILGKIIERLSGESYDRYVVSHIFTAARMTRSGFFTPDSVVDNIAVGYMRQMMHGEALWTSNLMSLTQRGGPAGGAYSTAGDLYRFAKALRRGELVDTVTLRAFLTPKPELGARGYGYGFAFADSGRVVGHAGGFPGVVDNLDLFVGSEYLTIVLGNLTHGHSGAGASLVIDDLRAWVRSNAPTAHAH